jgi:hypothetical protein
VPIATVEKARRATEQSAHQGDGHANRQVDDVEGRGAERGSRAGRRMGLGELLVGGKGARGDQ